VRIELTIQDDGKGFDVGGVLKKGKPTGDIGSIEFEGTSETFRWGI